MKTQYWILTALFLGSAFSVQAKDTAHRPQPGESTAVAAMPRYEKFRRESWNGYVSEHRTIRFGPVEPSENASSHHRHLPSYFTVSLAPTPAYGNPLEAGAMLIGP